MFLILGYKLQQLKKENERIKVLSIWQMLIHTNTDDHTVSQFLDEEHTSGYTLPYSESFVKKHRLTHPTQTEFLAE